MAVKLCSQIPAPDNHSLFAFLISEHNLEETRTFLLSQFGEGHTAGENYSDRGFVNHYADGSKKLLFIGLGNESISLEDLRKSTHTAVQQANDQRLTKLCLIYLQGENPDADNYTAIAEAAVLSNYQFLPYKTEKKINSLQEICLYGADDFSNAVESGRIIGEVTTHSRDLVNEPTITLTAEELSNRAVALGERYQFSVEVLNKAKIQALKMGGLLAVNYGSPLPPTFTIMEWKPENAVNSQPVVLVGKGVVYDTGGLSLKPTANSMDFMKSDMAGAAAVIGAMCGVAGQNLPLHVIGLVPATDNRPGQNAYTPGDVIKMYSGSTVEVLNTDAEGRMILADALHYAKKYDPELVIDLATLTGAAVIAVGIIGIAMMSTAGDEVVAEMENAGNKVYERVVRLPLWDEYGEQLKSDIADLKNVGGKPAGSITAGKFLEHFTDYPWVHLDIAGPSFLQSGDSYRGKNGTGAGVRLLLEFLRNQSLKGQA